MEYKSPEERINFSRMMISQDCPKILAILNRWENIGVYCIGIENHCNSESAEFVPKSLDFNFFPSMHVCKVAQDIMHYIKIITYDKSVYVIPLIKKNVEGEIKFIQESVDEK